MRRDVAEFKSWRCDSIACFVCMCFFARCYHSIVNKDYQNVIFFVRKPTEAQKQEMRNAAKGVAKEVGEVAKDAAKDAAKEEAEGLFESLRGCFSSE